MDLLELYYCLNGSTSMHEHCIIKYLYDVLFRHTQFAVLSGSLIAVFVCKLF